MAGSTKPTRVRVVGRWASASRIRKTRTRCTPGTSQDGGGKLQPGPGEGTLEFAGEGSLGPRAVCGCGFAERVGTPGTSGRAGFLYHRQTAPCKSRDRIGWSATGGCPRGGSGGSGGFQRPPGGNRGHDVAARGAAGDGRRVRQGDSAGTDRTSWVCVAGES